MDFSFTQTLLSSFAFGAGYYLKTRFEINQEDTIKKLQKEMKDTKKANEEKYQKIKYKLWEMTQERDRLNSNFLDFQEKVKNESFNSIQKEQKAKNSKSKVLNSFL